MLAETLALFLSVTSTGTPRAQPGLEVPDNFARARRGLLPRKVVRSRPPPRGRRLVLRPDPPTWLGEPAVLADPPPDGAVDGAVELAVDTAAQPVAARVEPAAAVMAPEATPEVRAALEGADVELLLLRRLAEPEGAAVQATLGDPQLEVVVLRRLADVP